MHGEEQQLQIQQPNWQENLDPQLLSRVKQIIARRNTEFILDHQNCLLYTSVDIPKLQSDLSLKMT